MLALSGNTRIYFYDQPVSMHKSFEGLSQLVEEFFPGELLTGSYFIFLNRRKEHIKILLWDSDGFVIWYKRLEKGTFSWSWQGKKVLDRKLFLMFLEGIEPKKIRRRFSY